MSVPTASWLVRGRKVLAATGIGFVVGILVCLPWVGRGFVIFLDWVPTPHGSIIPNQVFGLSGGLIAALPLNVLDSTLSHLLGSWATIVEVIGFFVVASWSIANLAGKVGSRGWVRVTAAQLLFCVNPFVFDRLYVGQIGILLGYAILPFGIKALIEARSRGFGGWLKVALWWVVLLSCAPHFAWIFAVPIAIWAVINVRHTRVLLGIGLSVVVTFLATLYVLVAGGVGGVGLRVGLRNLQAFRTASDPHFGLIVNVLGLYGFWRTGPTLAKQVITGWPILLIIVLTITIYGYVMRWKRSKDVWAQRQVVILLVTTGVLGAILAMGSQGPFGSIFTWMYLHVPYFNIMREPEKFSMLLAVSYAIGFAWGVEALYRGAQGKTARLAAVVIAAMVVLAYEPLLFFGVSGQIPTSHYPASWYAANRLMGSGDGRILAFPWHQYLSYPFTQNRVVANLSPGFFSRPVISGDNVQLPNIPTSATSRESGFIQYLIDHGDQTHYFGSLLTQLGVKYVVLEKTVDWRLYGWLSAQRDLKEVMDSRSLLVFRNLAYEGVAYRAATAVTVPTWGSMLALSERNLLSNVVVRVEHASPGPLEITRRTNVVVGPPAGGGQPVVHSRTAIQVPGGTGWIVLTDSYVPGWTLSGHKAVLLATGTMGVKGSTHAAVLNFGRAGFVELAEAFSGLVVLLDAAWVAFERSFKFGSKSSDNV